MTNSLKKHFVPVLFLVTAVFTFSFSMLFSPYSNETFGHDAGVFAYIGYAITQGKPMYTGAWDNKGPLLYFINALGIIINYRYGIYILEVISLFVTMLLMYKTALFFVPRYIALISTLLSVMPLTITLEGGNLSEEWALPFTAAAFYLIVKFFCGGYRLRRYEMMIVGACIAAIVLLRLNNIMFIAMSVLCIIIILLRKKQVKILAETALYAFIGFAVFTVPIAAYLIATGTLSACLETAYFGAVGAFSEITKMQMLINVSAMVFNFIKSGGFFVIILFIAVFPFYLYKTKGEASVFKTLLIICYLSLFATLAGNSVSGAKHMHYFICFIPVMLLPVVWFAKAIYMFFCENSGKTFAATASVTALAFLISVNSVADLRSNIINNLRDGTNDYLNSQSVKISEYVKTHSSPEETVLILGGAPAVTSYYRAKRLAASKYFYYANGRFSEEAKKIFASEIMEDIEENLPRIIIFTHESKMQDFIQHLDNSLEYTDFIEENYVAVENDFSYMTYILNTGSGS